MQIRLAENIRALRRQHRFTQEQLAESLGVTPGAVYKWEAGLSQPELAIIVELADLFDTSVDVLLGYEVKDPPSDDGGAPAAVPDGEGSRGTCGGGKGAAKIPERL